MQRPFGCLSKQRDDRTSRRVPIRFSCKVTQISKDFQPQTVISIDPLFFCLITLVYIRAAQPKICVFHSTEYNCHHEKIL